MQVLQTAIDEFTNVFGESPTAAGIAPGRVEVLGNHTDYNDGFILSAAIDRHIVIVGRAIDGTTAHVFSGSFRVGETFDINNPVKNEKNFWLNYIQGVVSELNKKGIKTGAFEAFVTGDVPLGAGLSSSAALEVATLLFLKQLFGFEMNQIDAALTAQAAENKFVGVNCGILDQFSSAMGKQDHLIFLDCRDLKKYDHIPLGSNAALVLANSMAKHALADGTYNRLREACHCAARHFAGVLGEHVTHLRDVTVDDFDHNHHGLDSDSRPRAKHVITENQRVLDGVNGLKSGDLSVMGDCMLASHASSRDDFGNSCDELDMLVRCAIGIDGFYGCRLSGGGFGGCTVNLVQSDKAESFAAELADRYKSQTGIDAEIYVCKAVDGARAQAL